jgi:hypothetical protein
MPNNSYVIENTRFAYRTNLAGDPTRSKYADDRRMATFIIPDNLVDDMAANGVKIKQTRPGKNHPNPEEFESENFVQAQAKFKNRAGDMVRFPPKIYLVCGDAEPRLLDEEDLELIDRIPVKNVNVVLNEYRRTPDDNPSLYIRTMYVEQDMYSDYVDYNYDPFASEYRNE